MNTAASPPVAGSPPGTTPVGVVVIGRNEGDRLLACLRSVCAPGRQVVYVDSGSTDGSVERSRDLGADVVALDLRQPFTAARARNAGFRRLLELQPEAGYVFFVDGDCEVDGRWLETATRFLDEHPDMAVACGRRRERHPERSVYNLLCDLEWDTPVGEARACGGDAVMRVSALQQVQGYRSDLICGEEPELCIRLRQAGWRIWRLPAQMTLHDAAMLHFGQWWTRTRRTGYAYAQGTALHGAPPERHWVRESRRAWLMGLVVPLATTLLCIVMGPWALLLLCIYPLQFIRLGLRGPRAPRERWWRAAALVAGKFPEMLGQLKFLLDRLTRRQARLIEYK